MGKTVVIRVSPEFREKFLRKKQKIMEENRKSRSHASAVLEEVLDSRLDNFNLKDELNTLERKMKRNRIR